MVAERNNSNAVFSSGRGGVVCSVADGRVVVSHDSDLQSVVDAKVSQLASLTAILSCAGSDHLDRPFPIAPSFPPLWRE